MSSEHEQPIPSVAAPPAAPVEHRLMVLMFTDMVNSSGLKMRLGDLDYAAKIAQPHNALFRSVLARFSGAAELNYTGDGFLAVFRCVSDAVEAALLFQEKLRQHLWQSDPVQTRIGIHVGQAVLLEGGDPHQTTIASHAADVCARLMSLGAGGQTLLTRHAFDDARQYVRTHPDPGDGAAAPPLAWAAHGRYRFKGMDDDPFEVFEVGAAGLAPLTAPGDGEKARRLLDADEEETLGWRPSAQGDVPGRPGWGLEEMLGTGGFGEVWLVRQRKTGEPRVFKFCFDPERLRSLKRELTIFRLIRETLGDRDDIARLYDVRLDQPPFYLESEYVPLGNLVQWAERRGGLATVPKETRLGLMKGICEAVAAAHSLGIIHKDIKPSNILIREDASGQPRPVLADFGIGIVTDRAQFGEHGITETGLTSLVTDNASSRTGTRLYAPPESLIGAPPSVQTDIFALGVLLYQLTIADFQRPLATGWETDVSDSIVRDDIAAATAGQREKRLATVKELLDRLATQSRRQRRRRRWTAVQVAFLIVALLSSYLADKFRKEEKESRRKVDEIRREADMYGRKADEWRRKADEARNKGEEIQGKIDEMKQDLVQMGYNLDKTLLKMLKRIVTLEPPAAIAELNESLDPLAKVQAAGEITEFQKLLLKTRETIAPLEPPEAIAELKSVLDAWTKVHEPE